MSKTKIRNTSDDFKKRNKLKSRKPKLSDFYDELDPRGCSTSEYNKYLNALNDWEDKNEK